MSFDLDISHYTRDELIDMFELPRHYTPRMVEDREAKLRENIMANKQPVVQKAVQVQTLNFLARAKQILLSRPSEPPLSEEVANANFELQYTPVTDGLTHAVQARPDKPYLSSFPGEFFQGVINPLKKRTIRKNLNIDTRFRENYYSTASTNFNLSLPTNFNEVVQMQLASLELPASFYAISKQYGNNYFTLTLHFSDGMNESQDVVISSGNYTPQALIDAINAQLTVSPFSNVVFVLDACGKTLVGLKASDPSLASLSLQFNLDKLGNEDRNTPLPLKLGWVLGFRSSVYAGNLNYVSEGVIDTTGAKYLFLVVDDYTNNTNNGFFSAFSTSVLNNNILARISLQASPLNLNNLNLVTTPREYFGPVNINNLTIQLLDEYGRIVDLNNCDFSFCLTLVTAYDL